MLIVYVMFLTLRDGLPGAAVEFRDYAKFADEVEFDKNVHFGGHRTSFYSEVTFAEDVCFE